MPVSLAAALGGALLCCGLFRLAAARREAGAPAA
jgi:hypothetical protein